MTLPGIRVITAMIVTFVALSANCGRAQNSNDPQSNLGSGPYTIHVNSDANFCTDVSGASVADGTAIQAFSCNGTGAQSWSLVSVPGAGSDSYEVVSVNSGSCLSVSGDSGANGSTLQQWGCFNPVAATQIWQVVRFGSRYELISSASGKCMDLTNGKASNGTRLQQWDCNNGWNPNQLWNIDASQSSGTTSQTLASGPYLVQPISNASVCMDVRGGSSSDGTAVQSYSCNGTLSQSWSLVPVAVASGNAYELVSTVSRSCLAISGNSVENGASTQQWACQGASQRAQLWQISQFQSSYELVSLNSGRCLDLTNGSSQNGNQLQQWDCDNGGNPNQLWSLVPTVSAGYGGATPSTIPVTLSTVDAGEQALQSDAFVDSVGVQTHLAYDNTGYYTMWPYVLSELKASGIRHLRDGLWNWASYAPYNAEHQALAAAGIRTTYGISLDYTMTPQLIESLAFAAGDMEAIEAPNECDAGDNCGGGGLTGINNVVAFMPYIATAGAALHVPVIGPSFAIPASYASAGDLSSLVAYSNLHVYYGVANPGNAGWGGGDAQGNRYGSLAFWMDQATQESTIPVQITETGYVTTPPGGNPHTLPEAVTALYTPRTLLLAFNRGVKRTFLYELMDEQASSGYGLLRSDGSEKPAFTAVKGLLNLLSDPGATFTPGSLNYAVSGGDGTINHTLLQRRDGSYWLALWSEQSGYDASAGQPSAVATQDVVLSVSGPVAAQQIVQFDDTGVATTSSLSAPTQSLPLTIGGELTMIHITPQ